MLEFKPNENRNFHVWSLFYTEHLEQCLTHSGCITIFAEWIRVTNNVIHIGWSKLSLRSSLWMKQKLFSYFHYQYPNHSHLKTLYLLVWSYYILPHWTVNFMRTATVLKWLSTLFLVLSTGDICWIKQINLKGWKRRASHGNNIPKSRLPGTMSAALN